MNSDNQNQLTLSKISFIRVYLIKDIQSMDIEVISPPVFQDLLEDNFHQHRNGCYFRSNPNQNLNKFLPLKHIDYHLQITNSILNTTLIQSYSNPKDMFLQTYYCITIHPQASVYKFQVKFANVIIEGVIKEKTEAQNIYKKQKEKGRSVAMGSFKNEKKEQLKIQIGNIPPKTDFTITISTLQELQISVNTFYKLLIPSKFSPNFMFAFDNNSKNFQKGTLDATIPNYTWSFKIDLKTAHQVNFCESSTHKISIISQNQAKTQTVLVMQQSERPYKDFIFLYSTKNFHLPSYLMSKTDSSCSALLSFIPKYCSLNLNDAYQAEIKNKGNFDTDFGSVRGDYIFLLDRSCSMIGKRIKKATESLVIFLKSLPQDSYFNVISFGSRVQKLFNTSIKYCTSQLNVAIDKVRKMRANLGGTLIFQILKEVLSQKVNQNYPKQVFLLTDGQVSDTPEILNLVRSNTKYSRVHSIGIGKDASKQLIEGCAEAGKGNFTFIDDSQDPCQKIITLLESSLSPVISKINLSFSEEDVESIVPNPKSIPYILKDSPVNFYITFKSSSISKLEKEKQSFIFSYQDSFNRLPYQSQIQVAVNSQLNQPFVDKMCHLKFLQSLQNSVQNRVNLQDLAFYVKVKDYKKQAIQYSVKNQILSKYTSFICVGKQLNDGEYQQFSLKNTYFSSQEVFQYESNNYKFGSGNIVYRARGVAAGFRGGARSRGGGGGRGGGMNWGMGMVGISRNGSRSRSRSRNRNREKEEEFVSSMSQYSSSLDKPRNRGHRKRNKDIKENKSKKKSRVRRRSSSSQSDSVSSFSSQQSPKKTFKDDQKSNKNMPEQNKIENKAQVIKQLIQSQNSNGSWTNKNIVNNLLSNSSQFIDIMSKNGICDDKMGIVLTKIVILWLQKYKNEKKYSLIVRKAKFWVENELKQLSKQWQLNTLAPIVNCAEY